MIAALEPSAIDLILAGQVVLIFGPTPPPTEVAGTDGVGSSDLATPRVEIALAGGIDGSGVLCRSEAVATAIIVGKTQVIAADGANTTDMGISNPKEAMASDGISTGENAIGSVPGDAYYVDKNHGSASDSNPGTEALPWETIEKAAATLVAGETVYVKNGTYVETTGCSWTTPALNPANSGTAGNPIAFRAYPGHMPTISNSVSTNCPVIGTNNRDYIIWDGFEVSLPGYKGSVVWNSQNVTIERCKIHGMWEPGGDNCDGIRIEDSSDITIRNNEIYDVHNGNGNGNAAAVKIYNSERITIENNEAHDCDAGLRNKAAGVDVTFRYNLVYNCPKYGLEPKNGTDQVYGNIIVNCGDGAHVDDTGATPLTTCEIYNNTFVECSDRSIEMHLDTPDPVVYNNIIYDSGAPESGISECSHNLYWIGSTGCGAAVVADPLFMRSAYRSDHPEDFKLQPSSPARESGKNDEDIGAYATGNETIGRY
jgi:parallel beta-helix repeat protein